MIPLHDNVPTRHLPILTVALIVINLAVFVWAEHAPAERLPTNLGIPVKVSGFTAVTAEYGFVPCEIESRCAHGDDEILLGQDQLGRPVYGHVHHIPVLASVFTAMFMHGSWEHVLGNMLFLWIFGNNIEDRVGRRRYLIFYALGGLAASLLQFLSGPTSDLPNIGASGAIAAVLGGYLVLYPKAAVITYIPPIFLIPLPAVLFLIGWILLQVYSASSSQVGGGGVAYYAHIGGFAFGLLTIRWWVGRNERRPTPPAPPSAWPA
ncbi:MAG TPA: rhomboid family intramembrane serine protease [Gaiellales bacterium]|jgi:membrane associated rhomboid family serine protease